LQSGAIVVSAIGIIISVIWSKVVAGRRATLDVLILEQTDLNHVEMRTQFVTLRDEGNLSKFADSSKTHGEGAQTIRAVLNRYELVAVGISSGSLDKKSYMKWCRSTLVKDWTFAKAFITQIRTNSANPEIYIEFEKLAKKWATKEEKSHI
jgi:hypothetical protein